VRIFSATVLFVVFCSVLARGASPQQASPPQAVPAKPDPASGKLIFERHCSLCHGIDGGGGRGPSLRRPKLSHVADEQSLKGLIENGYPPEMPPAWFLTEEELKNTAAYVFGLGSVPQEKIAGDPAQGRQLYARNGCSSCHRIEGQGSSFAPDLSDVGARRGAAHLRETLRNPAKTMPEDFLLVEAVTTSGQAIRGIRLNEDTFTIQLKDSQSRFYSFRKSELRDLKKLRGETPMPAYASVLSETELDDLIAFLASQRGKP